MDELLRDLIKKVRAKGALVVTNDGMVVAGFVRADTRKDVVGALSSFLISATNRCLSQGNVGGFNRIFLKATHGKILIQALKDYFVVVLTDQFSDKTELIDETMRIASKLRKLTTLQS
jgi:predicted regulator of Ras-like GTPase activity (Roadblock/LC7/MglB family)